MKPYAGCFAALRRIYAVDFKKSFNSFEVRWR